MCGVVEGHVLSERGTPISDVALKVTYQIGSYGITRALEGGKQETEHDVLRPDTNAFFSLRKQCSLVIIQVDDSRYQIAGPKNEAPDIWFCEFLVTPDNPLIHNRSDKDLKIILKNRVGEVQNGGSVPWRGTSQVGHNHCVQRTVAIRSHQPQTVRQWRLAPAADAAR